MSALSDYMENKLLDHLLKNTVYTQPATLYFGLFTADPGESGVTSELTIGTGAYARAAITNNNVNFPQCASSGTPTKTNGAIIQFPTATTAWGTVTHWAIYDAASTGTNMIMHGALSAPRYIAVGDSPKIAAGALSITITNATSGGLTEFAQRKLLDHVFGGPTYTPAATVYTGLGTSLSGEFISEWTESSYDRKSTAFGSASGGVSTNTGAVTFTTNVLDGTATLSSFGIWDDPTAGNLLVVGPVSTSRTVNIGDTANIAISGFTATLQ
jgi:hypothetical protein